MEERLAQDVAVVSYLGECGDSNMDDPLTLLSPSISHRWYGKLKEQEILLTMSFINFFTRQAR